MAKEWNWLSPTSNTVHSSAPAKTVQ